MAITIALFDGRVSVRHRGETIAESRNVLALREGALPVTYYFPREDIRMDRLEKTAHASHCPHKGDASYWSVAGAQNAAWSYETPFPAVAAITGRIAFWAGRVDAIDVDGA